MKLKYSISSQDTVAYIKYMRTRMTRRSKIPTVRHMAVWAILGFSSVSAVHFTKIDVFLEYAPINDTSFLMSLFILSVALLILMYNRRQIAILNSVYAAKDSSFLGEFTLEFDPAGFAIFAENYQTRYSWNILKSVEVADEYIYVLIGGFGGHQIPRSAFSSEEDAEAFVREFTSRRSPPAAA